MEPETSKIPTDTQPAQGLPPVAPPTGRFIAQLFLVPGLIVTFAILVILGLNYLFVAVQSGENYLQKLDSGNPDIRWRGAHDLAQDLKRPESRLRAEPKFALDLAQRVHNALAELRQKEQNTAARIKGLSEKEKQQAWLKLNPQRDHARFLTSALGDFVVPVGANLLCEMALDQDGPDIQGNMDQRRKAIWALGNLGENLKSFAKLLPEQQQSIRDYLQQEAGGSSPRADWARTGLYYLEERNRPPAPPGVVEVDRVLAGCARDEDRFLRRLVALVLNFWDGPLTEATLLELTRDDGHGTLISSPGID